MRLIDEAYHKAIGVLEKCVHEKGLYASGTREGYTSVWARDSVISLLGGALIGTKFKSVFQRSLATLAKYQTPLGQIPNAVGIYDVLRKSYVTYNTLDSSLWFIIGVRVYAKAYRDQSILQEYKKSLKRALLWVRYQDVSDEHLPAQLPTTDWQDAFPHKYGHTINTAALYYAVLKMLGESNEAAHIKQLISGNIKPHLKLFDNSRGYYLPWAWKDHVGDREEEYWFDALGNLLAIVTGLAQPGQARSILRYIERTKINRPYPVKAIFPPITLKSKLWKSYFSKSDARTPYHYLNAGIWPFIGGFYVVALVKARQFKKAEQELELLAKANYLGRTRLRDAKRPYGVAQWEFNEWLHGKTGKPMGGIYHAWSAGMYIFAYECVKRKQVPFF